MPRGPKYKIHEDKEGKTVELNLRVAIIDNGYVIKAGGPPFFCSDNEDLVGALNDMLGRFLKETNAKNRDKT